MWINNLMKTLLDITMGGILVVSVIMIAAWIIGRVKNRIDNDICKGGKNNG